VERPFRLSVISCFGQAARSFAGWWLPLCLVSGLLVAANLLPRLLVLDDLGALAEQAGQWFGSLLTLEIDAYESETAALSRQTQAVLLALVKYSLLLLPLAAVLTVVLFMVANRAAGGGAAGRGRPLRVLLISAANVAVVLVVALAFVPLVAPGVYLYVRLSFFSLSMLEDPSRTVLGACRESFALTRGSFWPLMLLYLASALIVSASAVTVIGLIPATGFASTARAAAFRALLEHRRPAPAAG
jgi:hypothetical protein